LLNWLAEPVEPVRDVRNLLLLKLFLLNRAGLDSSTLVEAQAARLTPMLEGLESMVDKSEGFDKVMAAWKTASCRTALEFLAAVLP
jgi:hypothetical protein